MGMSHHLNIRNTNEEIFLSNSAFWFIDKFPTQFYKTEYLSHPAPDDTYASMYSVFSDHRNSHSTPLQWIDDAGRVVRHWQ
jgi:hypothetical protein